MARQAQQQFSAKRIAAAVSIALYLPPPEAPKPRQQHPKPETKPEPRPPSPVALLNAMAFREAVAYVLDRSDDPALRRMAELAEMEVDSVEDDLGAEIDRREAAERELAEAKARIFRLECVLESEGVPTALWVQRGW